MKFSRLLSAVIASAALVTALASHAAAQTDVVFGNLGISGTGSLSATNTDFGGGALTDPVASLAQGFTTGTSSQYLTVQSVTLGLFSDDLPSTRTVSIFSNNAGVPGTAIYTSNAEAVTTTGKYTFTFSSTVLSPNTSYWIVPQGPASWYLNSPFSLPQAFNSSGWSHLGTKQAATASPSSWVDADLPNYSVSITAVPEPSTFALTGIAIAAAGLMRWRRRNTGR
jgi:hypothetical protein